MLVENNLSLNIGPSFTQQQWDPRSVVDGVILQDSFKVAIETKLNCSLQSCRECLWS